MRIATWNVNSLKARQEAVESWLERAAPDVLLMQETKLTDADAPVMAFAMAGYQLVHHGEGRWNGVAIAARNGHRDRRTSSRTSATGRSAIPARAAPARRISEEDFDPFDEARMLAATVDGLRVVERSTPRTAGSSDSPFYAGKLAWFERLARWVGETSARPGRATWSWAATSTSRPTDDDVWDPAAAHGGTHVSEPERAAFRALLDLGLTDGYRVRPRRAGPLHVVGLPRGHVPQELRDADRPPARVRAGRGADRGRRDRPRGAQGPAGAVRPCPADASTSTSRASHSTPDWAGALSRIAARSR